MACVASCGRSIAGRGAQIWVPQTDKLAMLGRIAELGSHVADVDLFPPSLEDIYTQISRRDAA